MRDMNILLIILRVVLAATFAVAAVGKFADLAGSRKSMRDFGLPARLAGLFSVGVPAVELAAATFDESFIPELYANLENAKAVCAALGA